MSNLDNRVIRVKRDPITVIVWAKNNWELIKKYWKAAGIILMAIWMGVQTAVTYYNDNTTETTTVVVDEQTFQDAVRRNKIEATPESNQILSRFSDSSIQAELVIPTSAEVYKLVKIRTDKTANFYDLLVMTVYNGNIVFVDTVQTINKGEWVFTGPPGQYAVRLSAYDPAIGVSVETGNVVIGQPIPNPNPIPVPNPNPTPNPNPEPNPTPNPVFTEKYGFATLSFQSAGKVEAAARKQYKESLANNFESMASAIAAGSYDTPNAANTELAGRNRMTFNNNQTEINKWLVFFQDWQAKAQELNKAGKLPNLVSEYREVYLETAKGLRASQ